MVRNKVTGRDVLGSALSSLAQIFLCVVVLGLRNCHTAIRASRCWKTQQQCDGILQEGRLA